MACNAGSNMGGAGKACGTTCGGNIAIIIAVKSGWPGAALHRRRGGPEAALQVAVPDARGAAKCAVGHQVRWWLAAPATAVEGV